MEFPRLLRCLQRFGDLQLLLADPREAQQGPTYRALEPSSPVWAVSRARLGLESETERTPAMPGHARGISRANL